MSAALFYLVAVCCFFMQLMKQKSCISHLFRATAEVPVSLRKILLLLAPQFAVEGSNLRQQQDACYSRFINYMRQVASKCCSLQWLISVITIVSFLIQLILTDVEINV